MLPDHVLRFRSRHREHRASILTDIVLTQDQKAERALVAPVPGSLIWSSLVARTLHSFLEAHKFTYVSEFDGPGRRVGSGTNLQ